MKNTAFEIGVYTIGDMAPHPQTNETITAHQRIKEIIRAATLAEEVGLDVYGVGEHHRLDYAVSATPIVLTAIAQVTQTIKLTSATTVLSTVDPVRLFEDYATLDLISDGRAEIITGRGAFLESFPLFGYKVKDYGALFEENMKLLMKLNQHERVSWNGHFRSPLEDSEIAPRPFQSTLPIWTGVGGTRESATLAGRLGTGMALAILKDDPISFQPLIEAYRKAIKESGYPPHQQRVAITGHGYLADSSEQATEEYFSYYKNYQKYMNRRKGIQKNFTREEYEQMIGMKDALYVGSPEQIIEKILYQHEIFGHQRFMVQLDIGGMPYEKVAKSIELLGTKVAPAVRRALSN